MRLLSTTVDAELLSSARSARSGLGYAALVDEALGALLARHRAAEVDASYVAYDDQPADEPDVGRRPVVVLSRDAAIPRLRRVLFGPGTTTIRGLASEVVLEPNSDPVPRRSAVNLDSVEGVSVAVLVSRLGRPADTQMHAICAALAIALDCAA